MSLTILETMHDPALFGKWFDDRASWRAWETFLAVLTGRSIGGADLELYQRCTGRTAAPTAAAREAWLVAGRRAGKSRVAALVAIYAACFGDYRQLLAPGEVATVALIAADRRQARVCLRYVNGFLDAVPMLKATVTKRTRESVELANHVAIEVHTASFRLTRGYTLAAVICDEIAFWRSDESTNPDTEILNGLRPGLATIPGAVLLCISSPYARRGALWEAYKKHYGQDGDPVLVWQADTRTMNPNFDPQIVADAYADDEAAAAAEYGAEFRRDIESFVSREAVDACVIPERHELPPVAGTHYVGFVDPSGGSQDSMTLAIAHAAGDVLVLDLVRERRPPFSPEDVVAEFAEVLKLYRIGRVTGDRYAGEWPRERFRVHGVDYDVAERTRSELYRDLLPLLNSARVELLEHPKLLKQLSALERRTTRAGKDSIDHGPGGHDDVINAAAGALLAARVPACLYEYITLSEKQYSPGLPDHRGDRDQGSSNRHGRFADF